MLESLRLLYRSHGGPKAIFQSSYFLISIAIAGMCWRSAVDDTWEAVAFNALPALAGFSIAAYAILFAVLDERSRNALSAPDPRIGNRSPLLIIVSSVSHAVIIQISTLIYAFVYSQKPFPYFIHCVDVKIVNLAFSAIGLFSFIYSILLVLASVLSLYRILEIRTRI